MSMDKNYDPEALEAHWLQAWEAAGLFQPDLTRSSTDSHFCIMIPPPNVTGSLHMGHAFQHTLMDILVRYQRSMGKNTLWQAGTDHAGIATQMVVERQLAQKGQSRIELGRDAFLEAVWDWKAESGNRIGTQIQRMGSSVDRTTERFTMDPEFSKAVSQVFVQLFEEGLIYKGKRLVNWDPVLQTAISDLEVNSEEEQGFLWHLRYPLVSGAGYVVVATTRPETLLGDVAVAVHPDDARYQSWIGQMVELPLTGRQIPIIGDSSVEMDFGTGAVKITPAHDFNDYQMGQRHGLPLINIFTSQAKLNDQVPTVFQGLDRGDARKQVLEALDALGLLDSIKPHPLKVPRGDRTGAIIEPYLTDQWYVKVESLAKPAIEAVESGQIQFVPKNWENTYFAWMNQLEDWCISRQLWWGHRIPAWYDQSGQCFVGLTEKGVREKYQLAEDLILTQETDVLDTWFSSALWTFATLGWPENTERLQRFHSTDVLVTGFDIIFFWVARMIMMTLKFTGQVPFKTVYVHGLVRDNEGQKMSKSKGNVLDPLDLVDGIDLSALIEKRTQGLMQPQKAKAIEKSTRKQFPNGIEAYGVDALRFTFCALASTGRDVQFDMNRLVGYRNFCNKLWNVARFIQMNVQDFQQDTFIEADIELSTDTRLLCAWIKSEVSQTIATVHDALAQFRFDWAAQEVHDLTWHKVCDWFVELSKPLLARKGADAWWVQKTLLEVLETLLRLLFPIIPFITESIWQNFKAYLGFNESFIQQRPFPQAQEIDQDAVTDVLWLQEIITQLRQMRGELNLSPSQKIKLCLASDNPIDRQRIACFQLLIQTLAKVEDCSWQASGDDCVATAWIGTLSLQIPFGDLIDLDAELARLNKQKLQLEKDQTSLSLKLANEAFVANAPASIVDTENKRLAETIKLLDEINEQLRRLELRAASKIL
jgi:valyl-tRNA synthetase